MGSFLDKFDAEQKFNLFIGESFNQINNIPTRLDISKLILSQINQNYKDQVKNSSSLAKVSQLYLDTIMSSKKNLFQFMNNLFPVEEYKNLELYRVLLESQLFKSIMTLNYDFILEENFESLIDKRTPFINSSSLSEKIKFYKIFGDINTYEKSIVTSQDIKRLEMLQNYKSFWKEIREEFNKRPTILLGMNLLDQDLISVLAFILDNMDEIKHNIYIIDSNSILDQDILNFINKYRMKVLTISENEFILELPVKNTELTEIKEEVVDVEKKIAW